MNETGKETPSVLSTVNCKFLDKLNFGDVGQSEVSFIKGMTVYGIILNIHSYYGVSN